MEPAHSLREFKTLDAGLMKRQERNEEQDAGMLIHHHDTYSGSPRHNIAQTDSENKNRNAESNKSLISSGKFFFAYGNFVDSRLICSSRIGHSTIGR
jgi:hypothetical protein